MVNPYFMGVDYYQMKILILLLWLFNTWLKCMSGQAPNAIITDQDGVMQVAIGIVFPKAKHRFCSDI